MEGIKGRSKEKRVSRERKKTDKKNKKDKDCR